MAAGSNAFPTAVLNAEPVVRSVGNIVARYGLAIVIGWIGIFKFYPVPRRNIHRSGRRRDHATAEIRQGQKERL